MTERSAGSGPILAVIPIGPIGELAVRMIAANLQAVFEVPVDLLAAAELPDHAFEETRQQYDAGRLLDHLAGICPNRYGKVLGVVAVDLCIPILTYVFGEAQLGGTAALVSGYRLRGSAAGAPVPMDQYYERLAKVALHEMAHTFTLYHCLEPGCVMNSSAKLEDLDRLDPVFCQRCEFSLQRNLLQREP